MLNPVRIRPAIVSEQKDLEALQRRASLNNAGDREALLANPDAIQLPLEQIAANRVFLAERDGAIVGFFAVLPREDGETELDALFVEPDLWRQGVGKLLIEHCADVARAQGSAQLHVVGNPHAKEFYTACGFQVTGTVRTRFGLGLALIKKL
jgi:N-acetylglutamate synthase-like GNAT family acetyltransferase